MLYMNDSHYVQSKYIYVSTSIAASAVKKTSVFFPPYHPKQIQPTKAQADLFRLLQSFVAEFVARHGSLMQSLWLDEITLKAPLLLDQPEMWKPQETKRLVINLTKPRFLRVEMPFKWGVYKPLV